MIPTLLTELDSGPLEGKRKTPVSSSLIAVESGEAEMRRALAVAKAITVFSKRFLGLITPSFPGLCLDRSSHA
jgi:hypothetical protein